MNSVQEKIQEEDPNLTPGWGVVEISNQKFPSKILDICNNKLSLQIFPDHNFVFNLPFDSREINQYKFNIKISKLLEIEEANCKFIPSLHIALDCNFLIPLCHYNKIL